MRHRSGKVATGSHGPADAKGGGLQRPSSSDQGGGGSGNDGDTYVETVGYMKRPTAADKMGNGVVGLLLGPLFVFSGCLLLWNNENWAVKRHMSLQEARDSFVAIETGTVGDLFDAAFSVPYRGKLVHLSHMLSTAGDVHDPFFEWSRPNVVSLHRTVEMYQWVEKITKQKVKRYTETEVQELVTYKKQWVASPIDSDKFRYRGHENDCCSSLPVTSGDFRTPQVYLGPFTLGSSLVRQITRSTPVPVRDIPTLPEGAHLATQENVVYIPRSDGGTSTKAELPNAEVQESVLRIDGEEKTVFVIEATGESFSTREKAMEANAERQVEETVLHMDGEERIVFVVRATGESFSTREKAIQAVQSAISSNGQQETQQRRIWTGAQDFETKIEIGDVRVTFSEVPCAVVSILAKLSDNGKVLTEWQSQKGGGSHVAELSYGAVNAVDMIGSAQTANTMKTWALRGAGWLLNVVGYSMMTSLISTTADVTLNWIPLVGPMAMSLINIGITLANLVLANCTTLLVVSIAWVMYRPILGVSLLVGSFGLFLAASKAGRAKVPPP